MKDMTATVHELRELKLMREELDAQIEELSDIIKAELTSRGTTSLMGSDWRVNWAEVSSKRLNQRLLKSRYPEIVEECSDIVSYRKFSVK